MRAAPDAIHLFALTRFINQRRGAVSRVYLHSLQPELGIQKYIAYIQNTAHVRTAATKFGQQINIASCARGRSVPTLADKEVDQNSRRVRTRTLSC